MAWFTPSQSFAEGWNPGPQLQAAPIHGVLGEILQQRRADEQLRRQQLADMIKTAQNVRGEMQADKYLESLKEAGVIPQDYEAGGIGGAEMAGPLAKQIMAQKQADARAALLGAQTEKVQTMTDYIKQHGRTPGSRGGGGAATAATQAEVPEDYYGLSVAPGAPSQQTTRIINGIVHVHTGKGGWKPAPLWMQKQLLPESSQPTQPTKALSPSQINSLLKGYTLDRADITGGQHAGFKGGEPLPKDQPWEAADEIEVTPRAGGPPVKIPVSVFKQLKEQVYGTQETTSQQAQPQGGSGPGSTQTANGYGRPLGESQSGYIAGKTYAGRRYLGGDPNDANNWQ